MQGSANLNIMIKEVRIAARILNRDFVEIQSLQGNIGSAVKFAQRSRQRVAQSLMETLQEQRPHYGYAQTGEEEVQGGDPTRRWRISPLFGPLDFARGNANWGLSIALEHKGSISSAVVFLPVFDALYLAERGTGAWCNGRRIRVSDQSDLDPAVIVATLNDGQASLPETYYHRLGSLSQRVANVKTGIEGPAALCQLAAGRIDGYWGPRAIADDCAGAVLIAQEAGAMVNFEEFQNGSDTGASVTGAEVLASAPNMFGALGKAISH